MAKFLLINLETIANSPHIQLIKDVIDKFGQHHTIHTDPMNFELFWCMSDSDYELMKLELGNNIYQLLEKHAGLEIR